jgi:hypothetical protein
MQFCGMDVIKVPLFNHIQARTHKKRRINKKWLKRYGMKVVQIRPVSDSYYTGMNKIFVPEELWGIFMAAILSNR